MYEHILLATDGSEHANTAATHAVDVAARYDATLHVIYVIETRTAYDNAIVGPDEMRENLRKSGETALAEIRTLADQDGVQSVKATAPGLDPGVEADNTQSSLRLSMNCS